MPPLAPLRIQTVEYEHPTSIDTAVRSPSLLRRGRQARGRPPPLAAPGPGTDDVLAHQRNRYRSL